MLSSLDEVILMSTHNIQFHDQIEKKKKKKKKKKKHFFFLSYRNNFRRDSKISLN